MHNLDIIKITQIFSVDAILPLKKINEVNDALANNWVIINISNTPNQIGGNGSNKVGTVITLGKLKDKGITI